MDRTREKKQKEAFAAAVKKFNKSWDKGADNGNPVFTRKTKNTTATVFVLDPAADDMPIGGLEAIKAAQGTPYRMVPKADFFNKLVKFAQQEAGRYAMNCVEMEFGPEHERFTASDGRHLASHVFLTGYNSPLKESKVDKFHASAIDLAFVVGLLATAARGEVRMALAPATRTGYEWDAKKGNVEVQKDWFKLVLWGVPEYGGIQCCAVLESDGQWPDWRCVMPRTTKEFTLPLAFCDTMQTVSLVRDVVNQATRVDIVDGQVIMRARNSNGVTAESAPVYGTKPKDTTKYSDFSFGIDSEYVKHVADLIETRGCSANGEILLKYIDKDCGLVFELPGGSAHCYHIIMPIDL